MSKISYKDLRRIITPGKIINYSKHSRFIANVVTLLKGNISAQAISFLAAPIITRLYKPDDFGAMTLIGSFIGTLSVVACLRYESTIVIEKNDNEALHLFILCLSIASVFSLILLLITLFFRDVVATLFNIPQIENFLWFVPAGVLAASFYQTHTYWNTRLKNFSLLAVCRVGNSSLIASIKIISGFFLGSSALWLITGNILGSTVVAAVLCLLFLKEHFFELGKIVQKKMLFSLAQKYSQFPKYHALAGLLNSFSQNFPVWLFAYFFSPQVVGFYGLANSVLRKPLRLMVESLTKVFLQKISEKQAKGQILRNSLVKTTLGLAAIGVIPFGVLMFGGKYIFSFVFGENWSTAGFYAQLLAPWLFLLFIKPPSTQIVIVKQMLKFNFYFKLIETLLEILIIVSVCSVFRQPWIAIASFSATGVVANLYYIRFAFAQTKQH